LERKPLREPFGIGRDGWHEVTEDLHYTTGVNGVGEGDGAGKRFGDRVRLNLDGSLKGGQHNESKKSDEHGAGPVVLEVSGREAMLLQHF
jgi:hypothetical protein